MSVSRRAFVGYVGTAAVMAGFGGAAKALGNDETLLRPPGAQDTDHLFAACIKCDRCRSICPEEIIEISTLFDGIISARTPKLNYHRGYCTFCDECMRVCPTGAIKPFNEEQEKIGMAIIQPDRCLAYFTGCRVCIDECVYEAITANDSGHPQVSADKCNGCGICENVCPALILRSFPGGKRRGVVVVAPSEYQRLGTTTATLENGE
jgi:ferredoxin-type protein NapG